MVAADILQIERHNPVFAAGNARRAADEMEVERGHLHVRAVDAAAAERDGHSRRCARRE